MKLTQVLAIVISICLAQAITAAENAALNKHGASISVTSGAAKPLNTKWAKPKNMLAGDKAKGPIINDLSTGSITVTLPVDLSIEKVGIQASDYRGGFAMPKDFTISAPGQEPKAYVLEQKPGALQYFDYAVQGKEITIKFSSIYPPLKSKKKIVYGTVDKVEVIVSENLTERFKIPDTYIPNQTTFIMTTDNLNPQKVSPVIGKPFKVEEHPKTIWSQQDIDAFKAAIKTQPQAKEAYDGIIASCEQVINNAYVVPDEPDLGTNPAIANIHTSIAQGIANLGIGYALSNDERYAQECKRLLLGLAEKFESYPLHGHPKFKHDSSKWSWQRLGDAIWLIPAAWGYDLIHNSSSLSDADRDAIENKFIMPCVKNIMRSSSIIGAPTNWSVICCAAVMIGARVCDDESFYKKALLGNKGDKKSGIYFHLDKGIDDDGMWAEGAIGYQFMAIRGLIVMAEILWHDNIDIYSYRDNRLKLVFDSPIWYCYPGGSNSPAVHDSGSASLYGRDAHLYQYAQRRYGDKTYNSILHKVTPTFESIYNLFLPACDFKQIDAADLPAIPSILFPGVGFTINRTGFGEDSKYLFMDYGPNRSHGHDDKLNFNLFALGQELFGDAGSAWYSTDLYRMYYPYSIAHNTLTANEQSQIRSGGRLEVYGTAADMALIRASSDKAIPAAAMDRTMFLNDGRMYDIFWYAGGIPFSLDLLYHGNGQLEQQIATEAWSACPKEKPGYAYFSDPKIGSTNEHWQASWKVKNGLVNLHYIGEPGTEIVTTQTPHGGRDAPTVMVRRHGTNTVFAGAFDVIKNGSDPTITSIRKQQNDQCYLLSSDINDGSTEHLLVNFTNKTCKIGDWSFDGRLAFIQIQNNTVERFYIAGGSHLKSDSISIEISLPSLIAYQRISTDVAGLWNQSVEPCTISIKNLTGFTHVVNDSGRVDLGDAITLAPEALTELHNGQQSRISKILAHRMRAKREAQIAAEAAERKRLQEAFDQQLVDALANKPSAQAMVMIQAEDIAEENGGKVGITSKKTATYGAAFSGWNNRNHTLKYTFEVKESGYYQLHVKYCREGDEQLRSIMIDGAFPCEYAKAMVFPGTGGWSNGSDNWKLIPLTWGKALEKPFFIKLDAGQHTMTLNNLSGSGLNLDYIVLTPANTAVTKASVEQ